MRRNAYFPIVLLLFMLPVSVSASTGYPDTITSINYDSTLDTYGMAGSGDEADTSFYLTPTTGLSTTTTDTISTLFNMENTDSGGIIPSHYIGFDNDYISFKNMYAHFNNGSNTDSWSVNIKISGDNIVYFFLFGDAQNGDIINNGESVNAWIDYNWTGTSNLTVDEEVTTDVTGASQNWTVLNGWTASGVFAMDIQVGTKDSMLLEVQ